MTATTSLRERAVEVIARLRAPALMFDSDRRALADALEAALSTPPAGEWMPIASCPRNGAPILLGQVDDTEVLLGYAIQAGISGFDECGEYRDTRFVTHWQPLPPPPEPATQEVG